MWDNFQEKLRTWMKESLVILTFLIPAVSLALLEKLLFLEQRYRNTNTVATGTRAEIKPTNGRLCSGEWQQVRHGCVFCCLC